MSIKRIRVCDGCGKEKPLDQMYDLEKWYQDDFCTFECLEKWLKERRNLTNARKVVE
jgi:hypothetical protein